MYLLEKPKNPIYGQMYFDTQKEKFYTYKTKWVESKDITSISRITQVWHDNQWVIINFNCLKSGDRFKLYEPNGQIIIDDEGYTEWTVIEEAKKRTANKREFWSVTCEPIQSTI